MAAKAHTADKSPKKPTPTQTTTTFLFIANRNPTSPSLLDLLILKPERQVEVEAVLNVREPLHDHAEAGARATANVDEGFHAAELDGSIPVEQRFHEWLRHPLHSPLHQGVGFLVSSIVGVDGHSAVSVGEGLRPGGGGAVALVVVLQHVGGVGGVVAGGNEGAADLGEGVAAGAGDRGRGG
ncbi:hypothetical protein Cni_G25628 [Canna indica]|uniref:Uncharacterized protein n=1 Tax=Canna indica TaxID=4628 RepID=A0AAQ3KYA0_9LILI|nr:hypothetical protein Cni_G25628 [Canna indica]